MRDISRIRDLEFTRLNTRQVAQPFTEKGSGERYFKRECMNNITFDVGSTIWLFVDFFHVDFKNLPFLAKMCSNIRVCLHFEMVAQLTEKGSGECYFKRE